MIRIVLAWLLVLGSVVPSFAENVRIGVSLGLTGKYEKMGRQQMQAFKLWAEDVNARGGLLGRPVVLEMYDDASDPGNAIASYHKLIDSGVDLVFAPYSSALTRAVLPLATEHGYPLLASGAAADFLWQEGNQYIFGVFTPGSGYGTGFLDMIRDRGLDKVALVSADDPFSKAIFDGALARASELGIEVVYKKIFPKDKADMDEAALGASEAGARVLMVCGHYAESVAMRKALDSLAWTPEAYYASVGPAMDEYAQKLGDMAEHTFSSSLWEKQLFPGGLEFYNAYLDKYDEEPAYLAANAYAAGQILEAAVTQAGGLDRRAVRDALASMATDTIIGEYRVDGTGKQVGHTVFIIQWQDGAQRIVWPPERAEAAPVFP